MSEKMYSALIVCGDSRASELATLLASLFGIHGITGARQYRKWIEGRWRAVSEDALPSHPDLLLYHLGDQNLIPDNVEASAEFAFSTPGARRVERTGVVGIERPFAPGACPIEKDDVEEVVAFVLARRAGVRSPSVPIICQPIEGQEQLSALALLCQGYLSVYAAAEPDAASVFTIRAALDQMGWEDLVSTLGEAATDRIARRREEVNAVSWWTDVITWPKLEEAIDGEWGSDRGLRDALLPLINELKTEEGSVSPPVVADAYLALARGLTHAA